MAFGDFVEREDASDMGLELAFVHKFGGGTKDLAMAFLPDAVDAGRAHEFEDEGGAEAKELLRDFVRGRSDAGDESTIRCDAIEGAIEGIAADGVEYDGEAVA